LARLPFCFDVQCFHVIFFLFLDATDGEAVPAPVYRLIW
jgi:hypothetical protein